MSDPAPGQASLSIGDVAARTGLAPATVRMWEARHGFPEPQRLAGGHRRYGERDVDVLREAARLRDSGMSVEAAIERARRSVAAPARSIFARLRRLRPELAANVFRKQVLLALSNAIEDEYCARAERALIYGAFQRERFYRLAQPRWRELARIAVAAVAFAEFDRFRASPGEPVEAPLDPEDPLTREWALICDGPGYSACLAAWELPGGDRLPDRERRFETLWSVDPAVVRDAAREANDLLAGVAPGLAARLGERLADEPGRPGARELELLSALTTRMVAYVGS